MVDGDRSPEADTAELRRHVEALFDAFLAKDREAMRAGRSADWLGFQVRSTRLIRGVDEYMVHLDLLLDSLAVDSYEFVDFDVSIFGDTAMVCYLARDWLQVAGPGSARTILIRALDVYRRVASQWVQVGSNISTIADAAGPE